VAAPAPGKGRPQKPIAAPGGPLACATVDGMAPAHPPVDPAPRVLPDEPAAGIASLGATSGGVWSREQACAVLSPGAVDALVRSGVWQLVWPGVYADGGCVLTPEQSAFAAVLASGGAGQPLRRGRPHPSTGERTVRLVAVAAGRTAARVWQLPLVDDDDPATGRKDRLHHDVAVLSQRGDVVQGDQVLHRRQPAFGAGDLVGLASGLWLTSPLRTLIDCRLLLRPDAFVCVLDDALHRGLVSEAALAGACARIRTWRGAPAFRRAVGLADGRAESPGETLTRLVLRPVLPGLVPQVELFDEAVRPLARFDLADEDLRLAVELDGRLGHEGAAMVAKDRGRDRATEARGWVTERVTWFEVRRRQQALQRRVLARADELRRRAAAG
jgi:hypothetical protein